MVSFEINRLGCNLTLSKAPSLFFFLAPVAFYSCFILPKFLPFDSPFVLPQLLCFSKPLPAPSSSCSLSQCWMSILLRGMGKLIKVNYQYVSAKITQELRRNWVWIVPQPVPATPSPWNVFSKYQKLFWSTIIEYTSLFSCSSGISSTFTTTLSKCFSSVSSSISSFSNFSSFFTSSSCSDTRAGWIAQRASLRRPMLSCKRFLGKTFPSHFKLIFFDNWPDFDNLCKTCKLTNSSFLLRMPRSASCNLSGGKQKSSLDLVLQRLSIMIWDPNISFLWLQGFPWEMRSLKGWPGGKMHLCL